MELITTVTLGVITAVVIGVVQVAKQMGLPTKFAPLVAVLFGVIAAIGLSFFQATFAVIITGVIIGLSACGLYSGVKTTVAK